MKRFSKALFKPTRKTCPRCKRKLNYIDIRKSGYPLHYLAYELSKHFGVRIKRANIKRIAECPCNKTESWFDLDTIKHTSLHT